LSDDLGSENNMLVVKIFTGSRSFKGIKRVIYLILEPTSGNEQPGLTWFACKLYLCSTTKYISQHRFKYILPQLKLKLR
jgi:hypothetical protein